MLKRRYLWLLAAVFLLGACALPIGKSTSSSPGTPANQPANQPGTVATQSPAADTSGEVKGGVWERDDPRGDLLFCATGDTVPKSQSARLSPKISVDVTHASMEEITLKKPTVSLKGKMCAYQVTLAYARPVDMTGLAEGTISFTGGRVQAKYTFNINNGKLTWKADVTDTENHTALHPDNFSDFGLEVQGNEITLSIPCYAVPRAGDETTWHLNTFSSKSSGGQMYCDEVGSGTLPKPKVYWDGKSPITIQDASNDVIDLTHKTNGLPLPEADIVALQASLEPRNTPVSMQLSQFPPNEEMFTWRAVLRMNMSLVGPGQLLCGRDENGVSGFIDPQTLVFQPESGLAAFHTTDQGPACTFAPPTFATSGCVIVSGDFYLKDLNTDIQYKDRVDGPVLCYQQK